MRKQPEMTVWIRCDHARSQLKRGDAGGERSAVQLRIPYSAKMLRPGCRTRGVKEMSIDRANSENEISENRLRSRGCHHLSRHSSSRKDRSFLKNGAVCILKSGRIVAIVLPRFLNWPPVATADSRI